MRKYFYVVCKCEDGSIYRVDAGGWISKVTSIQNKVQIFRILAEKRFQTCFCRAIMQGKYRTESSKKEKLRKEMSRP